MFKNKKSLQDWKELMGSISKDIVQNKCQGIFLPIFLCIFLFLFSSRWTFAQTFRASSSSSSLSGESNITLNLPTGTTYGDVMIAVIGFRPDASQITPPDGWTLIRRTTQPSGAPNGQVVYWKAVSTNEPSSHSWIFDTSTGAVGGILTFYNVNTVSPVHVEAGATSSGGLSHEAPSVTTSVNNAMLVTAHSFGSCATWIPPTGMTEAVDVANLAVPNAGGISMEINYLTQEAAGATGTKTATTSGDHDTSVSHIIALLPRSNTFNAFQTGNWNDKSTWATSRFGTITSNTGSTTVSGSGTNFLQDLVPGDLLYSDSYGLIGTVSSVNSNTQITLNSNALLSLSGASYRSNGIPEAWDNTVIGILYGTNAVTLTIDVSEAFCNNLTFESSNATIEYTLSIPSGTALNASGSSFLTLPSKAGAINSINVSGTYTTGSLTLQSVTTGAGRISQLNISNGTANIGGDIIFSSNYNAKVNVTGSGRLNVGGNFLTWNSGSPPTTFATSSTINFESSSTLNFNGVDKQQCLLGHGTYGNVYFNNTGSNFATLNADITSTNVKGDIIIQSGSFTNQGAATISH